MPQTPTAHQYLRGEKKPLQSSGIVAGLLNATGYGLLAMVVSRFLGVPISGEEVGEIVASAKVLAIEIPVWIGLAGALIGLWGQWSRKAKVAWKGDGKKPWRSRGIVGNLVAAGAAATAFVQAIRLDADELQALLGDAAGQWQLTAPAAIALFAALKGIWARWQATKRIASTNGGSGRPGGDEDGDLFDDWPMGGAPLIVALVLLCSCETRRDLDGNPVGPVVQAGVVGAGVAIEVSGPEGNGIGGIFSLYPVTPMFSRLGREW